MAPSENTVLILIDPYNDFLHPEGRLTRTLQDSLDHNNTIEHMCEAVTAARKNGICIFYGLHQQWKPGFFQNWKHMTGSNMRQSEIHFFAEGSFGAKIYEGLEPSDQNGDVVVSKHWNSKYVCSRQFFRKRTTFMLIVPHSAHSGTPILSISSASVT